MKTQKSFFEQNGGTYMQLGDVLLPDLFILMLWHDKSPRRGTDLEGILLAFCGCSWEKNGEMQIRRNRHNTILL